MLNKLKSHLVTDYKVKSYVMLSIIFLLGFFAGMLVKDLITESPFEQVRSLREGGVINRLENNLDLTDEQKEKIKPILEKYERNLDAFIQSGASFFRSSSESLKTELKPYLTNEQFQKLDMEFQVPLRSRGVIGFGGRDLVNRLEKVLKLTEKQKKNILPILEKYEGPFEVSMQPGEASFNSPLDSLKNEIKPYLTEEQLKKLDEIFIPPVPPGHGIFFKE